MNGDFNFDVHVESDITRKIANATTIQNENGEQHTLHFTSFTHSFIHKKYTHTHKNSASDENNLLFRTF